MSNDDTPLSRQIRPPAAPHTLTHASYSMNSTPPTDGVAAVDRAVSVLFALESNPKAHTLAELSRATGLYKSTLLRLLSSLLRSGLVIRKGDGNYVLGHFAYRLGRAYEATHPLHEVILPVLQKLISEGTESASFHVKSDNKNRLVLLRINSQHPTLDSITTGDIFPIALGAPGKVLSASFPSSTKLVKEQLLFISFGERQAGCAAVATPVFDADQEVSGAISLSGPAERFTEDAVIKMGNLLLEAGEQATRALGGRWPLKKTEDYSGN